MQKRRFGDRPPRPSLRAIARYLGAIALLTLLYGLLAALSLVLPTPIFPIAAIWLPAGLAWAALAQYGLRYWPGVALPMAIICFGLLQQVGLPAAQLWFVTLICAFCSTLQATLGARIAQAVEGNKTLQLNDWRGVEGLCIAALLSSLLTTAISIWALCLAGIIAPHDVIYASKLWFFGHCLAIVLIGPLCLCFTANASRLWLARRFSFGLPIVVITAAVLLLLSYAWQKRLNDIQLWLNEHGDKVELNLQQGIAENIAVLHGVDALFNASNYVTAEEFDKFSSGYLQRLSAVKSMGWAVRADESSVPALQASMGNQFAIRSYPQAAGDRPLSPSPVKFPVVYAAPEAVQPAVLGLDLASEADRREAIFAAITLRSPAATTPTQLITQPDGPKSTLVFLPMFLSNNYPNGAEPQPVANMPSGIAIVVVNITGMLDKLFASLRDDLLLTVTDTLTGGGQALLFTHGSAVKKTYSSNNDKLATWESMVDMTNRQWHIELRMTPRLLASLRNWADTALLLATLFVAMSLVAFRLIITGHTERIETLIKARTEQLSASNKQLLELAEQRKQTNDRLKAQAAELQRSNKELQHFAYIATHDLQEPLRSITGFAGLLSKRYSDKLDDNGKEYIEFVRSGAERMRQIIVDLLAYTRAGSRELIIETVDVAELVADVLAELAPTIEKLNANVKTKSLPTLRGDRRLIAQVLHNVISNALKFHQQNSPPSIQISAAPLTPTEHPDGGWKIAVTDNGIGIRAEYHEQIFEIFKRLHSSVYYQGNGIGLAICRRAVSRHGGELTVDSAEGQGSTFSFTIPAKLPAPVELDSEPPTDA